MDAGFSQFRLDELSAHNRGPCSLSAASGHYPRARRLQLRYEARTDGRDHRRKLRLASRRRPPFVVAQPASRPPQRSPMPLWSFRVRRQSKAATALSTACDIQQRQTLPEPKRCRAPLATALSKATCPRLLHRLCPQPWRGKQPPLLCLTAQSRSWYEKGTPTTSGAVGGHAGRVEERTELCKYASCRESVDIAE